jgi:hypothetical protein
LVDFLSSVYQTLDAGKIRVIVNISECRQILISVFMVKIAASEHLKRVTVFSHLVSDFKGASRNFVLDFLHKILKNTAANC